ncbi:hypothetical protein HNR34_000404 [Geobacillus subterraneus]
MRATMKGTVALEQLIAASRGRWEPGIGARVNITLEFHAERQVGHGASFPLRMKSGLCVVCMAKKGGTARPFSSLAGRERFFILT